MRRVGIVALALVGALSSPSHGEVRTRRVEYRDGNVTLEGYLAYDDAKTLPSPGVLVVHDWMGVGPYVERRARELAGKGYVAFAADIYGKGVRPADAKAAGKLAGEYKADRKKLSKRAEAALLRLRQEKNVDPKRIAAIGFCFGGTTALELARGGAEIRAAASFHGNLDSPTPEDAKQIKAKLLVLHGAIDPFVKPEDISAFQKEMAEAKVDYQFIAYSGAVHSFTNPEAGNA